MPNEADMVESTQLNRQRGRDAENMLCPRPLLLLFHLVVLLTQLYCTNADTDTLVNSRRAAYNSAIKTISCRGGVMHPLAIPRGGDSDGVDGGGMFGLQRFFFKRRQARNKKKKPPDQMYHQQLQEQIVQLERVIRSTREEASQLRTSIKRITSETRRESFDTIQQSLKNENSLRDEIQILQKQIQTLQEAREALIQPLQNEKERADKAEELLQSERMKVQTTETQFKNQMETLRQSLLKEKQEEITKLKESNEQSLKEERERLQLQMQERLQAERIRSEEAVEQEKAKMRKLVKALAEREKKASASTAASVASGKRAEEEEGADVAIPPTVEKKKKSSSSCSDERESKKSSKKTTKVTGSAGSGRQNVTGTKKVVGANVRGSTK